VKYVTRETILRENLGLAAGLSRRLIHPRLARHCANLINEAV
jgi:hypothetical protein